MAGVEAMLEDRQPLNNSAKEKEMIRQIARNTDRKQASNALQNPYFSSIAEKHHSPYVCELLKQSSAIRGLSKDDVVNRFRSERKVEAPA